MNLVSFFDPFRVCGNSNESAGRRALPTKAVYFYVQRCGFGSRRSKTAILCNFVD